ncbi:hypothetical protein BD324DRAFT_350015 [Kockovaella imperatae]|uniref:Uncharacterized protein n=1 Tax=Kockovaella imperatae TaxID=4999 RepID=A0A1Y1UJV7_9TREE|nr:hypothetical protein BD324DRAFT_350015 [Kockovaella imperatae]ORX38343.1 hypothetical protein BD324DRAFT_350015 [Kockovaella imperatae]
MPGSTDHASGSWLTSWALLTATSLRITFCPIFQDPYSQGSPRRMLDPHTSIPFQMIPAPDPSQKWDFELDMADCVEVRSLRREEIGGRNVPVPPDGVGTEVLEMVCSDGKKQYIGVEGVGGRISWISAIWDVLLACKPEGQPLIPPPSPTKSSHHQVQQQRDVFGGSPGSNQRPIDEPSPFRPYSDHVPKQSSPLRPFERRESDEGPVGHGALPPVQKIGDRWVASSGVGVGASDLSEDPPPSRHLPDPLKTAVKQMFESPPPNEVGSGTGNERKQLYMATATGIQEYDDESDGGDQTIIPPRIRSPSINGAPIRFDSAATIGVGNKQSRDATERILAWQPATERELSIFARSPSRNNGRNGKQLGLGLSLNDDEKTAGDEVAQIMADLVLHNISAPASPHVGTDAGSVLGQEPLSEDVKKQIVEVLALVKELKEARTLQTQQTTDIARYLNELNTWLEKFVQNSAVELSSMSNRLDTLVGSKDDANDPNAPSKTSLPDLVSEIHNMLADQRKRNEEEGPVGQRLDGLLTMMGQERERQAGQQGMVEEVLTILARQRNDNEMLLRALANDLTSEIRGERIRFVEAMQQATTMNVTRHVEEFKKTLSAEVQKSIKELTRVKEEKRALESQIADLFALKAKFGGNSRRGSVEPSAAGQVNIIQAMAAAANPYNGGMGMAGMPAMAGQGGRVLPAPPG